MLFSRRDVQRAICRSSALVSREKLSDYVATLNATRIQSFHTEWELLILSRLSSKFSIQHEPVTKGRSRPDIVAKNPSGGRSIIADICCVSDEEARNRNPVDEFFDVFHRTATKLGVSTGTFDIRVAGDVEGPYGAARVELAIPKPHEMAAQIKRGFGKWLKQLAKTSNTMELNYSHMGIDVTYDPNGKYQGGSYLSYTSTYSIKGNPIWTQLDKKRKQLSRSKTPGLRGVVLCDCNCQTIGTTGRHGTDFSYDRIVAEFFQQQSGLDFVARVWTEDKQRSWGSRWHTKLNLKYCYRTSLCQAEIEFISSFCEALKLLPQPTKNAATAAAQYRAGQSSILDSFVGGFSVSDRIARFSSKEFCKLLAGSISSDQFFKEHTSSINKDCLIREFFDRNLTLGRSIRSIRVVRCENQNDDWIEVEFGSFDAAVSDYRSPPLPL